MFKTRRTENWLPWIGALSLLVVGGCKSDDQAELEAEMAQPIKLAKSTRPRPKATAVPKPTMPPLPELSAEQKAILTSAQQEIVDWAASVRASDESPPANRNGLVVAEPQGTTSLLDFGAGCGRWLHLFAAGQGELASTPLWGSVADSWRDMKRTNGRLGAADVAEFGRRAGVTHVATGQISGTPQKCALTYQLWRVDGKRRVGAPVQTTGTREQVIAQLPTMARELSQRVGVKSPMIPERCGVTAAEIAQLGAAVWKKYGAPSARSVEPLKAMSERTPLANLLLLRSGKVAVESTLWRQSVAQMIKQAPDNTLIVADVAWQNYGSLRPHIAVLKKLATRYPNNYLLDTAAMCWSRYNNDKSSATNYARQAVFNASANAQSWYELCSSLGNEAQNLRRGRYSGQINKAQWARLSSLYSEAEGAALQSTRLAPKDAYAWYLVAQAACFNSSEDLADAALWQSIHLEPANTDALERGLEMYQPKWYPDASKLKLVASIIEADDYAFDQLHQDAMWALASANLLPEANALLGRALARYGEAKQRNPKDPAPHYHLAYLAKNDSVNGSHFETAVDEFEQYLKLVPDDARVHYDLGYMLHYHFRRYSQAEKHYRAALQISPDYADANVGLGNITNYVRGDKKAAERHYRHALSKVDSGWAHVELSRLLLDTKRRDEALQHARLAIRAGYLSDNDAYTRLNLNPQQVLSELPAD
jgi:Flp pilus assembly protein TadD